MKDKLYNNNDKSTQGINEAQQKLAESLEKIAGTAPSAPPKAKPNKKSYEASEIPVMDYDVAEVEDFFNTVFHTVEDDANVLTWFSKTNAPYYPENEDRTMAKLKKSDRPYAFYYGASTCFKHEDGKLYNRKALFSALHVVVLDDIGTKVPLEKIPESLKPNYIIESSRGNFQYGYVLKDPITDLGLAEALIHLVYTSGLSDSGGKMPTKVVRMPCGVNGKEGEKKYDQVKLIELNDNYWTPEDLLKALDVGVTWEDVLKDPKAVNGGRTAMMVGTGAWSSIKHTAASLSGVVDQTLEWLYDNGYVQHDNGDWVTITCPWASGHTSGGNVAGYSPIGRGGEYNKQRSFKCQHEHCAGNTTSVFLSHIAEHGAPSVPIFDNVADLVASYAYISQDDIVARIRGVKNPTFMKITAFANTFPRTARVFEMDGKMIKQSESNMWKLAPNRLVLAGRVYDPTSTERVVEFDGQKHLNTYTYPEWGNGAYDEEDVTRFMAFLTYLIPTDTERDYFIEWLACKAQNPTFKGSAILMVAPTQGTGRTTLTDMITELFTHANVNKVTFNQLIAAGDAGMFNEWQESSIVTCDEVMSKDSSKFHTYEALKDMFDPRPKKTRVNAKYASARSVMLYTSYIMLTNHTSAIGALGDDRRVYVISNTLEPATHDFFIALNEWLGEKDVYGEAKWARSVWRWLQTLNANVAKMNDRAPSTYAKEAMIEDTSSVPDKLAIEICRLFDFAVPFKLVKQLATDVLFSSGVANYEDLAAITSRIVKDKTSVLKGNSGVVRIGGGVYKCRANNRTFLANNIVAIGKESSARLKKLATENLNKAKEVIDNYDATVKVLAAKLEDDF